jgi:prolyl oligopeptidase
MKRIAWPILTTVAISISIPASAEEGAIVYPETKRIDHVDTYHGTEVPDPYRWLEDDVRESQEVADWVAAQNEVSFGYLETLPDREAIEERITALWNYEKYSAPFRKGGRYYHYKNDGLQNQSVLYIRDSLDDTPQVLIDPNGWSADGTVALGSTAFSDDGKYVAYGVSESGSDWYTWRVMEIESREVLEDEIHWVKYSGATWTRDSKGFFYGRFDEPEEGEEFQGLTFNQKIYYHRVGTPQSDDVLVYQRADEPTWGFGVDVSEDGQYMIISAWIGTDSRNRVFYRDLTEPYAMPIDLIDHFEDEYTFVGNSGPVFYFKTGEDAPNKRVIAIDFRKPEKDHWREIIAEREEPLRGVGLIGNHFAASYLKDASTNVSIFTMDGEPVRDVAFPTLGSAGGFGGKQEDTETFYSFSSFTTPPSTYRYDITTGESQLLNRAEVDINPNDFEVKQVFYTSKDGTRVPMFITHKKGITLDGSNPTILYGYGGFNIPLTPGFSVSRVAWMERGGVYAVANLRGGGEYGETWHKAGTKLQKQNVFDDFIGAAEWLIKEGYARSSTLAIQGGSNGGLLVGAVMTQRPDLFGVCLPAVGVMDMLRFHTFTAGRFWTDDFGSSDDPEEFKAIYAYSPYHNLRENVAYPATLVTTADTDDRVVPGHSFKFAAALQRAHSGAAPVMIRIETRAGHGAGKPTSKRIEEIADQYAFALANLK